MLALKCLINYRHTAPPCLHRIPLKSSTTAQWVSQLLTFRHMWRRCIHMDEGKRCHLSLKLHFYIATPARTPVPVIIQAMHAWLHSIFCVFFFTWKHLSLLSVVQCILLHHWNPQGVWKGCYDSLFVMRSIAQGERYRPDPGEAVGFICFHSLTDRCKPALKRLTISVPAYLGLFMFWVGKKSRNSKNDTLWFNSLWV